MNRLSMPDATVVSSQFGRCSFGTPGIPGIADWDLVSNAFVPGEYKTSAISQERILHENDPPPIVERILTLVNLLPLSEISGEYSSPRPEKSSLITLDFPSIRFHIRRFQSGSGKVEFNGKLESLSLSELELQFLFPPLIASLTEKLEMEKKLYGRLEQVHEKGHQHALGLFTTVAVICSGVILKDFPWLMAQPRICVLVASVALIGLVSLGLHDRQ
jgi:hypothetical protein